MSVNKYGRHIAYKTHTAITLIGHIYPQFLHTGAKTQKTAMAASYVIAMFVLCFFFGQNQVNDMILLFAKTQHLL